MYLSNLINENTHLYKSIEKRPKIEGISLDSREVKKGMIFVALEGNKSNGIKFCDEAIAAGSSTILCNEKHLNKISDKKVNILITKNVILSMSQIIKKLFPRQPNNVVAITGTNGKTSIAFYLKNIWEKNKINGATIGTLGVNYKNKVINTKLTTPDSLTLHKHIHFLKKQNINYLAIEASSHGISQNRINLVFINRGVFSSFSRDHLDYHGTIEEYFKSKSTLFSQILSKNGVAIINNSCEYGKKIENLCKKRKIKVITFGGKKSDWVLDNIIFLKSYSNVFISVLGKQYKFRSKLTTYYQIENLICSMAIANSYKISISNCIKLVENIKEPPGRLEKIIYKKKNSFIYIDYAHTPIALKKTLNELRKTIKQNGKLLVLFGCGGDRDQGKRKLMGKYAAKYADKVYITDDNPRYENPETIRKQIIRFCKGAKEISDRKKAINFAIRKLKKFDLLLVAGKGHEKYQEIQGKYHFFDDKKIVIDAIKKQESILC